MMSGEGPFAFGSFPAVSGSMALGALGPPLRWPAVSPVQKEESKGGY